MAKQQHSPNFRHCHESTSSSQVNQKQENKLTPEFTPRICAKNTSGVIQNKSCVTICDQSLPQIIFRALDFTMEAAIKSSNNVHHDFVSVRHYLLPADMDMTQSRIQGRLRIKCFSLEWWVYLSQKMGKHFESWVNLNQYLGNPLESWDDSESLPGKPLESWVQSIQVFEILLESWADLN